MEPVLNNFYAVSANKQFYVDSILKIQKLGRSVKIQKPYVGSTLN